MQALLWPIVSWLLREVIVKFVLFAAIFLLLQLFMPVLISYLAGLATRQQINESISSLPAAMLYFGALLRLDVGIPAIISAYVARFLIRRLPVIG